MSGSEDDPNRVSENPPNDGNKTSKNTPQNASNEAETNENYEKNQKNQENTTENPKKNAENPKNSENSYAARAAANGGAKNFSEKNESRDQITIMKDNYFNRNTGIRAARYANEVDKFRAHEVPEDTISHFQGLASTSAEGGDYYSIVYEIQSKGYDPNEQITRELLVETINKTLRDKIKLVQAELEEAIDDSAKRESLKLKIESLNSIIISAATDGSKNLTYGLINAQQSRFTNTEDLDRYQESISNQADEYLFTESFLTAKGTKFILKSPHKNPSNSVFMLAEFVLDLTILGKDNKFITDVLHEKILKPSKSKIVGNFTRTDIKRLGFATFVCILELTDNKVPISSYKNVIKCFNLSHLNFCTQCFSLGHYRSQCTQPCSNCGLIDHHVSKCRVQKKTSSNFPGFNFSNSTGSNPTGSHPTMNNNEEDFPAFSGSSNTRQNNAGNQFQTPKRTSRPRRAPVAPSTNNHRNIFDTFNDVQEDPSSQAGFTTAQSSFNFNVTSPTKKVKRSISGNLKTHTNVQMTADEAIMYANQMDQNASKSAHVDELNEKNLGSNENTTTVLEEELNSTTESTMDSTMEDIAQQSTNEDLSSKDDDNITNNNTTNHSTGDATASNYPGNGKPPNEPIGTSNPREHEPTIESEKPQSIFENENNKGVHETNLGEEHTESTSSSSDTNMSL